VNKSTAIELMVTGETFDFEKGLQLGVINQIWDMPNDQFIEAIQKYAENFCPPTRPPRPSAASSGRAERRRNPFESALAVERELQQQLFQSEDAKEGSRPTSRSASRTSARSNPARPARAPNDETPRLSRWRGVVAAAAVRPQVLDEHELGARAVLAIDQRLAVPAHTARTRIDGPR